jgi:hypothetical protein
MSYATRPGEGEAVAERNRIEGQRAVCAEHLAEARVSTEAAERLLEYAVLGDSAPGELDAQVVLLAEQAGRQLELGAGLLRRCRLTVVA